MTRFVAFASLALSCTALSIALLAFHQQKSDDFIPKLENQVKACLEYNNSIIKKDEVLSLLKAIDEKGYYIETGSDDLRIKFVNFQGCTEHVLACAQALGDITTLIGVIHTPTVATPLCVKPDEPISYGLLDESIRHDLDKLLTVRSRAQIVREYLVKGGKLYITYPQGGFEKRTPEQQKIYREELSNYPNNLFDCVLNCTAMDPDMIGATYLFRNQQRQIFAFSIKARQANDIQKQAEWGVWFGAIKDRNIANRINQVFDYLVECQGPDLRTQI